METKHLAACLVLLLSAGVANCGPGVGTGGLSSGRGQALVVTSDYQTGSLALVDLETRAVQISDRPTPAADTVCRYDPITRRPYLVSRFGADAISVLDPDDSWRVSAEYSVGPGSNPQDLAVVSAERAYVVRYGHPELLVVHPTSGAQLGTVDLGPYADADGIPEAAWALVVDDQVFVTLQRLTDFAPSDHSSLLALHAGSGEVHREISLTGTNPFSRLRHVASLDRIAVTEAGRFGMSDGGLELIAPDAVAAPGFGVTEQALGGDLVDVVIHDPTKGYAVIGVTQPDGSMTTALVTFDPGTGERTGLLLEADAYDHSFLTLDPDRRQLWVTERTRTGPGVRVFDLDTDAELTDGPLDTGLPPFMVCIVPGP